MKLGIDFALTLVLWVLGLGTWLFCIFLCARAWLGFFRPRFASLEETKAWGLDKGDFDLSIFDLPWQHSTLKTRQASQLAIHTLAAPQNQTVRGTVVLVHGIAWSWHGMLKYVPRLHTEGWNLVCFDLPGHGESSSGKHKAPSFGYYEKYAIYEVAQFARSRFPTGAFVALGESMGAASVLQFAELDAACDFVVADSTYDTARSIFSYRLGVEKVPGLLIPLVLWVVDLGARLFRGFHLGQISPLGAAGKTKAGILLIHGLEDRYVPSTMSQRIYENLTKTKLGLNPRGVYTCEDARYIQLLLVPGARHGASIRTNPEAWMAAFRDMAANFCYHTN